MKSFDIKTTIYFGENALDRLSELSCTRILVISDPFVVKSGMIRLLTDRLQKAGKEFSVYDDIVPDPPIDKITAGVRVLLEYDADCIVAVGGGSAIDSAKGIREVARQMHPERAVRLIAIPTTSGTGSEVTNFSVISDPEHNTKFPLVADTLLPQEAILDVELVKSVPPKVTADTGMDVFTHALESYVSTDNNEFSAALAEKSIEIFGAFMLRSYLDGNDTHARQKMHVASCLAGIAFNATGLGINHSLAHQLGAQFHIPHGRANAMLLPLVIQYNSGISKHSRSQAEYPKQVKKYCNIAQILGLRNFNTITTVRSLVSWVEYMMKEMDIPLCISELGVCTREEYYARIPTMAEAAMLDSCTRTNPKRPEKEDLEKILVEAW